MKELILNIINNYLNYFPEELDRQQQFINYLNDSNDEEICDWNNFNGHVVVGGFIYAIKDEKFLVLQHKDLNMYLYPGGHLDNTDVDPLMGAKREIKAETGLNNLEQLIIMNDKLIPIDIDTHIIPYNERLDLKSHYHFELRYLFTIPIIENITLDEIELANYKWISIKELENDENYGDISKKIEFLLEKNKAMINKS